MRVVSRPSRCLITSKKSVVLLAYELNWGNHASLYCRYQSGARLRRAIQANETTALLCNANRLWRESANHIPGRTKRKAFPTIFLLVG